MSPNPNIQLLTMYAVLPPDLPQVGEAFLAHLINPLRVTATLQNAQTQLVHLPILLR